MIDAALSTRARSRRSIFADEHDDYRESFRRFLAEEVVPRYDEWDRAGCVPRALFADMAEHGFLAMAVPEAYGGSGVDDFRFNAVLTEEAQHAGVGPAIMGPALHTDVCLPYFLDACTEEQRGRWLPGIAAGELITAVAMSEPGTGSDLAGMQTRARRAGDHYVVDGAKTFITNGVNADLVIVSAKTDPAERHGGISLLVVEAGMPGFERGRRLEKIGQHASDTAELFFADVAVPATNLLGAEGSGFRQLVAKLVQERLSISILALAAAEAALDLTLQYVSERRAFGRAIGTFQHSRFTLAEIRTELEVTRAFLDRCIERHCAGELSVEEAAMAKWWSTELQGRVVDRCVQLHGGYGYMREYAIARAYADARVTRIYAGANEVMKELIGRSMGLGDEATGADRR